MGESKSADVYCRQARQGRGRQIQWPDIGRVEKNSSLSHRVRHPEVAYIIEGHTHQKQVEFQQSGRRKEGRRL